MADDPQERARRCAEVMYAADQASRRLGISVGEVAPGRAVARMRVTGAMINGHHICHGGYVFLLADTAFAFACNTYDQVTVAAACDVVFVTPARVGDELVAEAVERLRYGRSGVYDVTVRRGGRGAGTGAATGAGTGGEVVAEFRGTARALAEPLLPPEAPDDAGGD